MKFTYRGVKYNSKYELADAFNINYHTLYARLSQGYSLDQALLNSKEFRNLAYKNKQIEFDGKKFNHITDLAKFYSISVKRAEQLLNGDIDLNHLEAYYDGWKSINVIIEGKKYSSWKEVVNDYPKNDLNESLLSNRYKLGKRGLELVKPKKHVTRNQCGHNVPITIDNHNFISLREASRFYNFNYEVLSNRYRRGIRGLELVKGYTKRSNKINKFQNKG